MLYSYGRAVSRRRVHELVYRLQEEYKVNLGFTFAGQPPLSRDLDEKLESLVEKGLLKVIYTVGSSYLSLYKPYYKVTEKGARTAEKSDFSKSDKEAIDRFVKELRPTPSQSAQPVQSEST